MNEPSLLVVQPQHNGTEVGAAALWLRVSADHSLKPVRDFNLQPLPAAMLLVWTVALLGQDPLQALLASDFKECFPLLGVVIGVPQSVAGDEQRHQFFFSLVQR